MKYFIGFVTTIVLIILLIIALISGGGDKKAKVPTTAKELSSYATTDAAVRMTIDGPVQADQKHQVVRVTVNKDSATFEQLDGYTGSLVNTKTYVNNSNAYAAFLHSLQRAGYTLGNDDKALKDERGVCALGNRYIFTLQDAGQTVQRYWTTSCGKTKTYKGDVSLTRSLFQKQIPDYNELMRNVDGIDGGSIF